ncbi:MAG: hypothetical protein HY939_02950 [Gammaproteobacteria bacterium]|nr:hypothetical protein [Gammaproteobacteria bacterium]
MPTKNVKLLALTALENTWGNSEDIVFSGEWCKLYERKHVWGARHHETIPFHWDDREKLKKDYDYLESLHHSLLTSLTDTLNRLHGVNYSTRYWQILLDPWLMSYISVLFDRWECLRYAFEFFDEYKIYFTTETIKPSFSYDDYLTQIFSDEWNQIIYQRIIENSPLKKSIIRKAKASCTSPKVSSKSNGNKKSIYNLKNLFGKAANLLDQLIGKYVYNYNVVFYWSYFDLFELISLNVSIGQIPRLFVNEFDQNRVNGLSDLKISESIRNNLQIDFAAKSSFETFIKKFIFHDMPVSIIEGYEHLSQYVKKIPIKTKAIVTANAHWGNIVAKFWFAEQIQKGVRLIILEHGGSLPAHKELFDFEEDISDLKGTWFSPYHKKHQQVPPSRLIKKYRDLSPHYHGKYCCFIGNEHPRWVHRIHFYPMAAQCLRSFDMTVQLYNYLDKSIGRHVKIKPPPYSSYLALNTEQRFKDILGEDHVLSEPTVDKVFKLAKLIVCTYPETTFAEAMTSGIPTVMFYPEEFYERHPSTQPLLDILHQANIVFHDPKSIAEHINCIWSEPWRWWSSSQVIKAREAFKKSAANVSIDWKNQWVQFLLNI